MEPGDYAALGVDPSRYLTHDDAAVRRLAVVALDALPADPTIMPALVQLLGSDPSARVRAEAAEALGRFGEEALPFLMAGADDAESVVTEAVATALGTVGSPQSVPHLMGWAAQHRDGLTREAAIAALGAIGDPKAVPLLVELVRSGPPQVRRRCVVALTVFDGDEVLEALELALDDRNPMVREAAGMVVGRSPAPDPVEGSDSPLDDPPPTARVPA